MSNNGNVSSIDDGYNAPIVNDDSDSEETYADILETSNKACNDTEWFIILRSLIIVLLRLSPKDLNNLVLKNVVLLINYNFGNIFEGQEIAKEIKFKCFFFLTQT